jgi:3-deoxy-manno-octulosonate cytidylyltransferase (CMP-KDO synthetase)
MRFKIVIPARMTSSRFPGKPLYPINGKPMLAHVVDQCAKSVQMSDIIVATDSIEIISFCNKNFINYFQTKEHHTGTDRIAEVNATLKLDYVINVQGDEPVFNFKDINLAIEKIMTQKFDLLVGYTQITDEKDWKDPNTIKIVFNSNEKVIYFSRAAIPGNKLNTFTRAHRSVNLYAYSRNALIHYAKASRTSLEVAEDHELLRFIDSDYEIYGVQMSNDSIPVDTQEDVRLVEQALKLKSVF